MSQCLSVYYPYEYMNIRTHICTHTHVGVCVCVSVFYIQEENYLAFNTICLIYINTKYQFTLLNHFDHHYSHIFGLLSPFPQIRPHINTNTLTLFCLSMWVRLPPMFTVYIICYAWDYNHVLKLLRWWDTLRVLLVEKKKEEKEKKTASHHWWWHNYMKHWR